MSLVISRRSSCVPSSRYAIVSVWLPAASEYVLTALPAAASCTSSQCQLVPIGMLFQFVHAPLSTRTQNESLALVATFTRPQILYVPAAETLNGITLWPV